MQVTHDPKTGDITIKIKANPPKPSISGNTMLVASETVKKAIVIDGHSLTVAVNAYFKPGK